MKYRYGVVFGELPLYSVPTAFVGDLVLTSNERSELADVEVHGKSVRGSPPPHGGLLRKSGTVSPAA